MTQFVDISQSVIGISDFACFVHNQRGGQRKDTIASGRIFF